MEIIREQATKLEDGAVLTAQGRYPAKQTVLCNGLGARDIAGVLPETGTNPASPKEAFQLRPVYGEVLQLQCPEHLQPLCDRVIRGFVEDRPIYIIPRSDGRITIGATSREDHRSGPQRHQSTIFCAMPSASCPELKNVNFSKLPPAHALAPPMIYLIWGESVLIW